MTGKPIAAAAMLGALCVPWQAATAQQQVRVAQNVAYVICAPKPGNVGQCIVKEPVNPCPAASAEAYPKKMYSTVRDACTEARKLPACQGVSGC